MHLLVLLKIESQHTHIVCIINFTAITIYMCIVHMTNRIIIEIPIIWTVAVVILSTMPILIVALAHVLCCACFRIFHHYDSGPLSIYNIYRDPYGIWFLFYFNMFNFSFIFRFHFTRLNFFNRIVWAQFNCH